MPADGRPKSPVRPPQHMLLLEEHKKQLEKDAQEYREARKRSARAQSEWFEGQVAALRARYEQELQPLLNAASQLQTANSLVDSLHVKLARADSLQEAVQALLCLQQAAADSNLTAATEWEQRFAEEQRERQKTHKDRFVEEMKQRQQSFLAELQEWKKSWKKAEQEFFATGTRGAALEAKAVAEPVRRSPTPSHRKKDARSAQTKQTANQQGNQRQR